MTRRLGSDAAVSLPGSMTATVIFAGLLWPAYDAWAEDAVTAAGAAIDDALFQLSLPPLRVVAVFAETDEGSVRLVLTMQARGDESAWANDTLFERSGPSGRETLAADAWEPIRDVDGSMDGLEANEGDLFDVPLEPDEPWSAWSDVRLWIRAGAAPPLVLDVFPPDRWTPLTELEWQEVR